MKFTNIMDALTGHILSEYGEQVHDLYVNDRDGQNEAAIDVQKLVDAGGSKDEYAAAIEKVANEYAAMIRGINEED